MLWLEILSKRSGRRVSNQATRKITRSRTKEDRGWDSNGYYPVGWASKTRLNSLSNRSSQASVQVSQVPPERLLSPLARNRNQLMDPWNPIYCISNGRSDAPSEGREAISETIPENELIPFLLSRPHLLQPEKRRCSSSLAALNPRSSYCPDPYP